MGQQYASPRDVYVLLRTRASVHNEQMRLRALGDDVPTAAAHPNKQTTVTFNEPVEIPGVNAQVLPAGVYVFRLLDSLSDRHIVQVFNKDESHIYATILAIPNYRLRAADTTPMTFAERAAGDPHAARGSTPSATLTSTSSSRPKRRSRKHGGRGIEGSERAHADHVLSVVFRRQRPEAVRHAWRARSLFVKPVGPGRLVRLLTIDGPLDFTGRSESRCRVHPPRDAGSKRETVQAMQLLRTCHGWAFAGGPGDSLHVQGAIFDFGNEHVFGFYEAFDDLAQVIQGTLLAANPPREF